MLLPGVLQVREGAAAAGVLLGGENALPCFVPGGVDQYALDRIVYNTKPWSPPLQVSQCPVLGCRPVSLSADTKHTPSLHGALLTLCTCQSLIAKGLVLRMGSGTVVNQTMLFANLHTNFKQADSHNMMRHSSCMLMSFCVWPCQVLVREYYTADDVLPLTADGHNGQSSPKPSACL